MKNPFKIYVISLAALAFGATAVYHHTQQSDINFYQGHRLFLRGDFRQAEGFLAKSLDHSPGRTDALREAAYCYLWTGRHKEAIESFETIIREGKPNEEDKRSLANAYAWSRRYDDAVKTLKELVFSTDRTVYKRRLARIYVWMKEYGKAKVVLEEVVKDDPSDTKAKVILAEALLRSGAQDRAIAILEGALAEMKAKK